jgi:hypothetical protein
MPYIDPKTVIAPKHRVESVRVVFDTGEVEGSWSLAELKFDKKETLGIRWNGDRGSQNGTPVAHGNPVWFILPDEIQEAVLNAAQQTSKTKEDALVEGYKMMAADRKREAEADEWTEGLIGDAY